MRKCVLTLLIIVAALGAAGCNESPSAAPGSAPELLKAVPSDALGIGLFGRLDHGLDRMVDSTSALRKLDYGKLSRSRAVVALCDVGTVAPLLVIEAGKTGTDTLAIVRELMDMADSLRIGRQLVELDTHLALLLCPSSTIIDVAGRHIVSESSILDAPDFDLVLPLLPSQDAVVLRNRVAAKLLNFNFGSFNSKAVAGFFKDAAEWTVMSEQKMWPVCPASERYFCSFMDAVQDGQSKLATAFPEGAEAIIDYPLASYSDWRRQYENWLDARIALEDYNKRLKALEKASGKKPLDWEKELGVKELALVMLPEGNLNMVRTAKSGSTDGVVVNPHKGFVRALYGSMFNAADSCCFRSGNWLISGDRALLDSLKLGRTSDWPAAARVVAWTPENHLNWTNESIRIWTSNQ